MSQGRSPSERAKDLARLWQGSVVPMEDESTSDVREARVVPALGRAIAGAAVRRRRELVGHRIATILALAAGVVLAIGLGGAVLHNFRHGTSEVAGAIGQVSGTVTLVRGSESSTVEGSSLALGDRFSTVTVDGAEVTLTNLVRARVAGSTALAVVTPIGSVHRLRLDRGEIRAQVDDRPSPTPKLIVETPNVEVVVTGTIFQVTVTPATAGAGAVTTVSVSKGRIVVRRDGAEVAAVTAGQSWTSAAPVATEAPRISEPPHGTAEHRAGHGGNAPPARSQERGTLAEENRLFQAAVEARNRGADSETITRLTELLGRYPSSPLAAEARIERMRALRRSGLATEANREAARYVADYPDGFAREEAVRLIGGPSSGTPAGAANDRRVPPTVSFPGRN